MKVRYSVRDLLLAVTIIGVVIGVVLEHNRQANKIEYLRSELTAQYQERQMLFHSIHSNLDLSANTTYKRDARSFLEYVEKDELEQVRHLQKVLAQ